MVLLFNKEKVQSLYGAVFCKELFIIYGRRCLCQHFEMGRKFYHHGRVFRLEEFVEFSSFPVTGQAVFVVCFF